MTEFSKIETGNDWQGVGDEAVFDDGDGACDPRNLALNAWQAPGPISAAFVASDVAIRGIMGPYGSAKTTTSYFDTIVKAMRQPRCIDGVRRHRVLTVRDTYRNLYKTAVASWLQWFPKEFGKWDGSGERPAKHVITFEDAYGPIEIIADFDALGERSPEDVLDGYEFTEAFLNGATSLPPEVLMYVTGRVGRWPRQSLLPPGAIAWSGVKMDFNPPDTDHWQYKLWKEGVLIGSDIKVNGKLPSEYHLFVQPGGDEPGAENLHNLKADYYQRLMRLNPSWWTRRFVQNKWGYSRAGVPVYETYDDQVHGCEYELTPVPNLPIYMGLDGGRTLNPAVVIGQVMPNSGQLRVIREFAPGRMGAQRFGELLDKILEVEFNGSQIGGIWADPTAGQGADSEGGEMSWLQTVEQIIGHHIDFAPTNELAARIDAVEALFAAPDGRNPNILIGAQCPIIRKGMMSHYRYQKQKRGAMEVASEKPEKLHPWSDVQDCLHYLGLGLFGETSSSRSRKHRGESNRRNSDDMGSGSANTFSADFDPMRY